jgi:hypothetical protein
LTWLIPITLLVAVCAMVGGLIARQVYAADRQPAGAPSAPATNSGTPTTTEKPSNPDSVDFREAARNDPAFGAVQNAMQSYFNAINHPNYDLWKSTVTAKVALSQTREAWEAGYNTTKDTDMVVYRIEIDTSRQDGLDVFGTFTSHQAPADGPDGMKVACIHWTIVWPLVKSGNGYLIDGSSLTKNPC